MILNQKPYKNIVILVNFNDFEREHITNTLLLFLILVILNQDPYKNIVNFVNFDDFEQKTYKNIVIFIIFDDFEWKTKQKHGYFC